MDEYVKEKIVTERVVFHSSFAYPQILNQEEARFNSADMNIAYRMPVGEYEKLCDYSQKLEENWGKPPGTLNTNGQDLLVFGKEFGNVFIGVQPTFGYEGDPMRLLFSKSASPHHGFAAYYTYLEKIFKANAVLHFGTHGSLEFMPGKQVRTGNIQPEKSIFLLYFNGYLSIFSSGGYVWRMLS